MKQKRWLVLGSAAIVLVAGAVLGLGRSSNADDPVRVFLVHGAVASVPGPSTSSGRHIRIFTAGGIANTWPTQVFGYLKDIEDDWIVLEQVGEDREGLEILIPRERVQLIEHIDEESLRVLLDR